MNILTRQLNWLANFTVHNTQQKFWCKSVWTVDLTYQCLPVHLREYCNHFETSVDGLILAGPSSKK